MSSGSFKKALQRIYKRYIVVVYNESNLQERVSISLTPLNLFFIFSIMLVLTFSVSALLFVFTPLKETIPMLNNSEGNIDPKEYWQLQARVDSLEQILEMHEELEKSLRKMLDADTSSQALYIGPGTQNKAGLPVRFASFVQDAPQQINKEQPSVETYHFFAPAKGFLSRGFSPADDHYAVDIVTYKNAPVNAIKDGHVIFAEWTAGTGHVIIIQHAGNLISVYKHNSVLLKKVGNFVHTGEAIALVGNSGEMTSGPHLHFELWQNGLALDPVSFILFN